MDDKNKEIINKIEEVINSLYELEVEVKTEKPKDESHGDLSTNIAMQLAGRLKRNPFDIAEEITEKLTDLEGIESVSVARPGFINLKVSEESYSSQFEKIILDPESLTKITVGKGKKVMIEFGQPNTHKAFHVGHLKSAISGLSLSRLYEKTGHEVIRANFYADIGMHVAKATWGYLNSDVPTNFDSMDIHERMKLIDHYYVFGSKMFKEDDQIQEDIKNLNRKLYTGEKDENWEIYEKLRVYSLEHQTDVWNQLGVVFDREYPESEVVAESLDLVKKNIGTLFEESNGAIILNAENIKGLNSWVFITGEGNPTYEAKDLGLGYKKFEEYPGLDLSIVTTSSEQIDRFKAIIYCLEKLDSKFENKYKHLPFGWMLRGGKKFSSRMGDSVKGMDIMTEVQSAAGLKIEENDVEVENIEETAKKIADAGLKFLILSHEFHKDFSYDPDKFLAFEGKTGPYLLYSIARAKSILEKNNSGISKINEVTFENKYDLELFKEYLKAKESILRSLDKKSPHIVAEYMFGLASLFSKFYEHSPVLSEENEDIKETRLALIRLYISLQESLLYILGIDPIEKM